MEKRLKPQPCSHMLYDARPPRRNNKILAVAIMASIAFHAALLTYFLLDRHPLVLYEPAAKEIILIDSFPPNETRSAHAEAAPKKPPKPAARPTPTLHVAPLAPATTEIAGSTPITAQPSTTRAAVSKSLQFGQNCATARSEGKPLPVGCTNVASTVPALGPKPVAQFQQAAAQADQRRKYLTSAGSPDLWKRNNHAPTPNDRPNDLPEYGLYDGNAKRQRVVGQCALTASCTKDGSDPRSPNYRRK